MIAGVLPDPVHKDRVYRSMLRHEVPVGDLGEHCTTLNAKVRAAAEEIAASGGEEIAHIRKHDRIRRIVRSRSVHPGLVHPFSMVESCTAWRVRSKRFPQPLGKPDPTEERLGPVSHRSTASTTTTDK